MARLLSTAAVRHEWSLLRQRFETHPHFIAGWQNGTDSRRFLSANRCRDGSIRGPDDFVLLGPKAFDHGHGGRQIMVRTTTHPTAE